MSIVFNWTFLNAHTPVSIYMYFLFSVNAFSGLIQ